MVRVLVVDDHALVRAGFISLLAGIEDIQVVGEASEGHEALQLIPTLAPDLVLIDISMPVMNGIETTLHISREFPKVRVVILSMYVSEEYVLQAMRAGANGYLLKDTSLAELTRAIHTVMSGETFISSQVSTHLINYVRRVGPETNVLELLTPRQREVLQLIAEGRTTQQIAQILGVSAKTIETHRSQLMDRLDIHDIAGLVRFAIRVGLIQSGL